MRHPNFPMHECFICDYQYDRENKKPLVLPCGHSYCAACVRDMRSNKRNTCPECRKNWGNVDIAHLTICYQLMPDAQQEGREDSSSGMVDSCEEHGIKNTFWCQTCTMLLCNICLDKNHKKCDWCLIETAVRNQVGILATTVGRVLSNIDEAQKKVDFALHNNTSKLSTLRMFKISIKDLETEAENVTKSLSSSKKDLEEGRKKLSEMNTENFDAKKLQDLVKTDKMSDAAPLPSLKSTLFDVAEAFKVNCLYFL